MSPDLPGGRKGEELEPNSYYCYVSEGWIYTRKGDYQTAIAKSQKALQLESTPWTYGWLGCAYALAGDRPKRQREDCSPDQVEPSVITSISVTAVPEKSQPSTSS